MTEATKPMTVASPSTEPSTWRREAPTVRSIESSRVRCAIVIEKLLKIMNAPTNRATPANTSSSVCRKLSPCFVSCASFCACSAPVRTVTALPSACCTRGTSAWALVPGAAWIEIPSTLPALSSTRCACGSGMMAIEAPANESSLPNLAMPTTV